MQSRNETNRPKTCTNTHHIIKPPTAQSRTNSKQSKTDAEYIDHSNQPIAVGYVCNTRLGGKKETRHASKPPSTKSNPPRERERNGREFTPGVVRCISLLESKSVQHACTACNKEREKAQGRFSDTAYFIYIATTTVIFGENVSGFTTVGGST